MDPDTRLGPKIPSFKEDFFNPLFKIRNLDFKQIFISAFIAECANIKKRLYLRIYYMKEF